MKRKKLLGFLAIIFSPIASFLVVRLSSISISNNSNLKDTLITIMSIFCGFLFTMLIFVNDKISTTNGVSIPDSDVQAYYKRYILFCEKLNKLIIFSIIISLVILISLFMSYFVGYPHVLDVVILAGLLLFTLVLVRIMCKLRAIFKEHFKQTQKYIDNIRF